MKVARRDILRWGVGALALTPAGALFPLPALAVEPTAHAPPQKTPISDADQRLAVEAGKVRAAAQAQIYEQGYLRIERQGRSESIDIRYRKGDDYDVRALGDLTWFWRDVNDQDLAVWIEPALFDFVSTVQYMMSAIHGSPLTFVLTSGYRTPRRNRTIENAAQNSQHIYGRAGDLKARGYNAASIAVAGEIAKGGGVGVYQRFTHLDCGAKRCWPVTCKRIMSAYGG